MWSGSRVDGAAPWVVAELAAGERGAVELIVDPADRAFVLQGGPGAALWQSDDAASWSESPVLAPIDTGCEEVGVGDVFLVARDVETDEPLRAPPGR